MRFARRDRFTDRSLNEAIERAARGLIDADLGGGLSKQRVARERQGRSGGCGMLVAYRAGTRGVFLYAFAKNQRGNIGPDEAMPETGDDQWAGQTDLRSSRRRPRARLAGIAAEAR